jgi:hypothetical protein
MFEMLGLWLLVRIQRAPPSDFQRVTERSARMRHHPMGPEVAPCGAVSPLIPTEAQ